MKACLLFLISMGLLCTDLLAQEKQKKDQLKLERNYSGNRFKLLNNYVSFGSGYASEINQIRGYFPFSAAFHFHIKRQFFRVGYFRSNLSGILGRPQPRELHDLHAGIGFRKETKSLNLGFYGCLTRSFGILSANEPYSGWGAYAEAQFMRKLFYDVGGGAVIFVEYNAFMPMAGIRLDIFLSGAYRGKINAQ